MALRTEAFRPIFKKHAEARVLDPRLLEAVAMTESSGDPMALREEPQIDDRSRGLMQILERTATGLGFPEIEDFDRLFDPDVSVLYGAKLIVHDLDAFNKSTKPRTDGAYTLLGTPFPFPVRVALARYNGGGRGNPDKDGVLRNESYVQKVERWFEKVVEDRGGYSFDDVTSGGSTTAPEG